MAGRWRGDGGEMASWRADWQAHATWWDQAPRSPPVDLWHLRPGLELWVAHALGMDAMGGDVL